MENRGEHTFTISGILTAGTGILLSSLYIYFAFDIRVPTIGDYLGPRFFPFVLGGTFFSLSILLLAQELRKKKDSSGKKDPFKSDKILVTGGTFILLTLYVAVLAYMGYILTTLLFAFLVMTLVERQRVFRNFLISVILVGAFYLVFGVWLNIPFPTLSI